MENAVAEGNNSKGSESRLVIEVGNESWYPGRTRFELLDTGQMLISHLFIGRETRFEGHIEPDRAGQMVADLAVAITSRPSRITTERRLPVPDEAIYQIEVYTGGDRVQAPYLTRTEVAEDAMLTSLIGELQAAIQEIVSEMGAREPQPRIL